MLFSSKRKGVCTERACVLTGWLLFIMWLWSSKSGNGWHKLALNNGVRRGVRAIYLWQGSFSLCTVLVDPRTQIAEDMIKGKRRDFPKSDTTFFRLLNSLLDNLYQTL